MGRQRGCAHLAQAEPAHAALESPQHDEIESVPAPAVKRPAWPPLLATAAALAAYMLVAALPGSALGCLVALAAAIATAYHGQGRIGRLLLCAALALPLVAVYAVLVRSNWTEPAAHLLRLTTALLSGLTVFYLVLNIAGRRTVLVHGAADDGLVGPLRQIVDRLASKIPQRWTELAETYHGAALVLAAAALPVGEGAGFAGGGLLLTLILLRHRSIQWTWFRNSRTSTICIAASVWLLAGTAAWILGGEGILRARDIGILGPFALMPVVALSAASVESRWVGRACGAFLLMLGFSATMGLSQYFLNLDRSDSLVALFASVSSYVQTRVPGHVDRMAATGIYVHRLTMAHVLVLGIGVLTARQLFATLQPARRRLEGALLGLLGLALVLTFTRAALLGVAAGTGACVLFAGWRWRLATAVAAALAVGAVFATPSVRQRIVSMGDAQTSSERGLIWAQAVEMVHSHRLGAGLSNHPSLAEHRYAQLNAPEVLPRNYAHSLVLTAWVETGPVGLVAYVWMWILFGLACGRVLWRRQHHPLAGRAPPGEYAVVAAAAGLYAATCLWMIGLTHDLFFHKPVTLAFMSLVGAVLALLPCDDNDPDGLTECSPEHAATLR